MNPKGNWIFRNQKMQFINEYIHAVYGIVYQVDKNKYYWEARTDLQTRNNMHESPPSGYAKTEDDAIQIVESVLKFTGTVKFE